MSVLMVVLDAADAGLVWRWTRQGELPVLKRMLVEGAAARFESEAAAIPESAWPTLTTGAGPGSHGVYNWRPVRPGTYQRTRQPPATCRKTVWHVLRDQLPEARVVVLDPPYSVPLGDDRVTEVIGWGERGGVRHESWPPELYGELVARHGSFPSWTEDDYVRWLPEERRLLRALLDAIERRTDILLELLGRADWRLGLACYYELHNGGHAFFRAFHPGASQARRAAFGQRALLRLYKAADASMGRLLEAVGEDVDVLVCSGKGFRPNTNGDMVLPQVMEGLGYQLPAAPSGRSRGIERARSLVRAVAPRPLRRRIFGRLSFEDRDRLLEALWMESVDWSRSRAFAEPDLGSAYVRLNVRGREPDGIVEPGEQYERLLAEVTEELLRLTHADSGEPAVSRVYRREEIAPGPNCDLMPDLVVSWTPAVALDAVSHPELGVVRERMKDLPTSEHTGSAFAIGLGPSFRAGASVENRSLADVAATVLQLAGGALPHDMEGRPLSELLEPSVPAERREQIDWSLDPWGLRR